MIYLVTWEFNKKQPLLYATKRRKLLAVFKNLSWKKDTGLDSVIFVDYTGTATQLYNYLAQCFDRYDRLVVTKVTSTNSQVFLTPAISSWIGTHW